MKFNLHAIPVFMVALLSAIGTIASAQAATVLVEAESFRNVGGWVIDTQATDQMGSSYLLAHGLGVPVKDATTVVDLPEPGKYRVFVRTRDWANVEKPSEAPGKFQIIFDGHAIKTTFGAEGAAWHWQDGGEVEITGKRATLSLHDLTGFEGRCDAILLTTDADVVPPNKNPEMRDWRRKLLGFSDKPENAGDFDLVVVGGGVAGCSAAVSAARLGVKVALIQERPLLGGNNSSEVRVHVMGQIHLKPYPHLGDLVAELTALKEVGNAGVASAYEDDKKNRVVQAEKNVTLFLNVHVDGVEKNGEKIRAVLGRNVVSGQEMRFAGRWFVDCTGDGALGALAGADFRIGRESRAETGEPRAPEKADMLVMGTSVQWYSAREKKPIAFPECPWALQFNDKTCQPMTRGDWDWEAGIGKDQIGDIERIRDLGFRAVYGNWAFLKNHYRNKARFANLRLDWMAYVGGKRESRRLLGDVILNEEDVAGAKKFQDASVTTTWPMDLHYPAPENSKHFPGEEFRSICKMRDVKPYAIPYRCLYSRNVSNLFMAGRNISVTHVALGTVRVMRTCGMMGEVVGMAASLCKKYDSTPRDVYEKHLDDLKALMTRGVGK